MKRISLLAALLLTMVGAKAQTQLTTSELQNLYTTTAGSWVSIHDPSVVFRNGTYTIWGSHLGVAQSKDLITWTGLSAGSSTFIKLAKQGATTGTKCDYSTAFNTQQVTKVKNYKGEEVDFPNFDAEAYAARYAQDKTTWVNGTMWAPDIIYNETMGKWCLYLSINGDYWSSIIILLTADAATGPFTYQGPIVMGGFTGHKYTKTYDDGTSATIAAASISETDMEIATGETTLPSRYIQDDNGKFWPNCIDPCVFFDEDGELWMTYGSWSGGIFLLKLDKETGLRDYTYTYTSDYDSKGASGISDPYFGKKIAGGYYVSGEGSYIQHIGNYYYLFVSYGGYAPNGGYEMRVFRSSKPEGPYMDGSNNLAVYTSYQMNYGTKAATNRGMKMLGSYNDWGGLQDVGECAQGHNSACTDDQGRSYVVYHTKFNDGTAGHQVRVHQLFTNEKGWLVAAPFCFAGETTTDADIAAGCPWTTDELVGDYQVLIHPYKMDYENYEEITPSKVTLTADGKVTGDLTGTWAMTDGTAYMTVKIGTTTYYGVFCPQHINGSTTKNYKTSGLEAIAFTAQSLGGVSLWGYKLEPKSAIAWNYSQYGVTLKDGTTVTNNLSLMYDTDNNTTLTWTSSNPDVISTTGKYAPLPTSTDVTLTQKLSCGNYYWEQAYNLVANKEVIPSGDYLSGLVAYYNFDETPTYNQYKPSTQTDYDKVTYGKFGSGTKPELQSDYERFGQVVHLYEGAISQNSYCRMPNPLLNDTEMTGFTVSALVKRTSEDIWDDLWSFFGSYSASAEDARLYLTGNSYLGYNDNAGNWFDLNYPSSTYTDIPTGEWALVTVTVGPSNGVRIYVNGVNKSLHTVSSSSGATTAKTLPYSDVVSKVATLKYFYLGSGSFWGSADCCIDELMIYNRELAFADVRAINTMVNRVTDFTKGENGTLVAPIAVEGQHSTKYQGFYDLSGRRVSQPTAHGIYIQDGKKILK